MIFIFLELLFGTIQALVFALLTAIYVTMAAGDHGHDEGMRMTMTRSTKTCRNPRPRRAFPRRRATERSGFTARVTRVTPVC